MFFKVSAATREHLEELGRRYGSMTAALEIAVDRMWRAETGGSPDTTATRGTEQHEGRPAVDA